MLKDRGSADVCVCVLGCLKIMSYIIMPHFTNPLMTSAWSKLTYAYHFPPWDTSKPSRSMQRTGVQPGEFNPRPLSQALSFESGTLARETE